ncbi:MAG: outer membrane beta-barrel protein [Taibaiella sp.]|jgi:opacity protein-like surface antigen
MKRITALTLATLTLASSAAAYAEDEDEIELYFTVGGGVTIPGQSSSSTGDTNTAYNAGLDIGEGLLTMRDMNWNNDFDTGFDANIAVGSEIYDDWRVELEFLYQNMGRDIGGDFLFEEENLDGSEVDHTLNSLANSSSTANVYSLLANLYYDFENRTDWTPFLGAGIGISFMDSDGGTAENGITYTVYPSKPSIEQSPDLYGTAFTWQVKAGVDYEIMEALSAGVLYRLIGSTNFKASEASITSNPNDPTKNLIYVLPGQDVSGLLNSTVDLYLRYWFS